MKTCCTCKQLLDAASFYRDSRAKDGLAYKCIECHKAYNKKYINTQAHRNASAKWKNKNKRRLSEYMSKYYADNKDKMSAFSKRWKEENKQAIKEYAKRHYEMNASSYHARNAKRRSAKLLAIPAWANLEAIEYVYLEASKLCKETGMKYHVDHIVPLQSEFVCGFHVHDNLQILEASQNASKKNHWWPDKP